MAKVPPDSSEFADVEPRPSAEQLNDAFIDSLMVLANHRRWAKDPSRFGLRDGITPSPEEAFKEGRRLL